MSNKKHYVCLLYRAFEKHGIDNFSFEVLDYTEEYNDIEKYYILLYNTQDNGYNISAGGENPPVKTREDNPFCEHTEEQISKIKYELKYGFKTFKEIANEYNYKNAGTISRINCGVIWQEKNEEYPIRKNHLSDVIVDEIINKLQNTQDNQYKIAKDFNIARSAVTMINIGENHRRDNINYPIRP